MKDVDEAELHENIRHERNVDDHLLDRGEVGQQTELAHELEDLHLEPEQPGEELAEDDFGVLLGRREDGLDVEQLRSTDQFTPPERTQLQNRVASASGGVSKPNRRQSAGV